MSRWRLWVLAGLLLLCACSRASPLPERAYVIGRQGGLQVLDLSAGKSERSLTFPDQSQAALSGDGRSLWLLRPIGTDEWRLRAVTTDTWDGGKAFAARPPDGTHFFTPTVVMAAEGRWLFALHRLWSGPGNSASDSWVDAFDTRSGRWLPERLPTGCFPWRLAASADGARIAGLCENEVSVTNRTQRKALRVALPGGDDLRNTLRSVDGAAFAPDGTLYVVRGDGTVAAIDPRRGTLLRSTRPDLPAGWGSSMNSLTLSPDGKQIYLTVSDLSHQEPKEVWVLRSADLTVATRLHPPVPFVHVTPSPDGASLYVLSPDRLHVLDAATGEVKRQVPLSLPTPAIYVLAPGGP